MWCYKLLNRGEKQALRPCAFSVYARRGFTVGHLQGNLNAASFQGVIPKVCGAVALCGLRKTNLHHPTTPTLSNLIPETSGPDKPANEAFLAALSVWLPSGASNRQCQTLQTASGKISQPIPSIQPSVYTGAIRVVCCKPGWLKPPSIWRSPPFFFQLRSQNERGTRRTNWLAVANVDRRETEITGWPLFTDYYQITAFFVEMPDVYA